MRQINAKVIVNPKRLNRPLATFHARQYHSFVAEFIGIPEDCYSLVCRVFKTDLQAYFDIPIAMGGDGEATAYIIGTCFESTGTAKQQGNSATSAFSRRRSCRD